MKPRTKFENIVVEANKKLLPVNPKVIVWGLDNLIKVPAFNTKNVTTCGNCGNSFTYKDNGSNVVCPHCERTLQIEKTLKRTLKSAVYFSSLEIVDCLQCQRIFRINVNFKKGSPLNLSYVEVCRLWLDRNGKSAVTALKKGMSYYWDSFVWDSNIELRKMDDTYMYLANSYVYPKFKLLPEIKRNGVKSFNLKVHPFELMKKALTDTRIETLLKTGNKKALCYFISNPSNLKLCWNSYKIALRTGYKIKDIGLWCDTIKMLEKLGKDINSPKYICPSDLKTEHDRLQNKVNLIENRKREMAQLQCAIEREDEFINSKSCYFGIVINDKEIEISVLDTIAKYKAEGDFMHHCVFTNAYYLKPHSIVLSAHYADGTRIETVEYSLIENKVIQCYGLNNKTTKLHDRIINLVNSNAHLFIEAKSKSA